MRTATEPIRQSMGEWFWSHSTSIIAALGSAAATIGGQDVEVRHRIDLEAANRRYQEEMEAANRRY